AVEDVVEPTVADPGDFTAAPELLAQHAHPAVDALADRMRFQRRLTLRGERGPLGLLAASLGLSIRDQVLGHIEVSLPSGSSDRQSDGTGSWRRADPATPPDGTAPRRRATRDAAGLRRCRR